MHGEHVGADRHDCDRAQVGGVVAAVLRGGSLTASAVVEASSVWPSAVAVATARAARLPPAPPRFSVTTLCLRRSPSFCPTRRAISSAMPPAANATTTLIVLRRVGLRSGRVGAGADDACDEDGARERSDHGVPFIVLGNAITPATAGGRPSCRSHDGADLGPVLHTTLFHQRQIFRVLPFAQRLLKTRPRLAAFVPVGNARALVNHANQVEVLEP